LAIKKDVDRHRHPGRYILTGSADVLTVPRLAGSPAGRMEVLTLWPLSMGEIKGTTENVVDGFFEEEFPQRCRPDPDFDLGANVLAGGFQETLQRKAPRRRGAWFESYLTTILGRDIRDLSKILNLAALPRLLALLAGRIASLQNQSELSRASGIPNATLTRHMAVLQDTFLVRLLPAWSSSPGKRLVKTPMFMVDTGLACHLMGMDLAGFLRGGELAGRVFENFVVLELF